MAEGKEIQDSNTLFHEIHREEKLDLSGMESNPVNISLHKCVFCNPNHSISPRLLLLFSCRKY